MRSRTSKARPRVEPLEDRTLMSTCHVTRLTDQGIGKGFRGDLRYCINKVNAEPGPDAIDFTVTGMINLSGALPDLSSDIDIQGPGAGLLTVRRSTGGDYRIFTNGGTVGMSGLTIADGLIKGNSGTPLVGGAIFNGGTLTLDGVVVENNGVWNDRYDAYGGGIANAGTLTVLKSTIRNNAAFSVSSGLAGAWVFGGGIYNSGTLTVIDSTISGNAASAPCNALAEAVLGGGIFNYSTGATWIYASTVSGNRAETNDDVFCPPGGAGIFALGGHLVIHNSTVSGNTDAEGVAIIDYATQALAYISHSTITGNTAGGVRVKDSDVFMGHSIVAGNTSFDLKDALTGSRYNLFGNSEGGSGYDPTDLLDVDPLLGSLADNGGPTSTHALLPGSPAIDAGDPNIVDPPDWDQRGPGFPRIVNGTIDIGAFEVQATPIPPVTPPSHRPGPDLALILATADLESLS